MRNRGVAPRKIVQAARTQRRQPTPMEAKLWDELRDRRLGGLKFRRQHPLGRFVLDIFSVDHQLAIEIDGPVHADPKQAAYDAARTEYLQQRGIRVLRFSNRELEQNLPDVLRRIVAATKEQ